MSSLQLDQRIRCSGIICIKDDLRRFRVDWLYFKSNNWRIFYRKHFPDFHQASHTFMHISFRGFSTSYRLEILRISDDLSDMFLMKDDHTFVLCRMISLMRMIIYFLMEDDQTHSYGECLYIFLNYSFSYA